MAGFGEEVKAETLLNPTCSSTSLFRVGSGDEGFNEPGQLPSLIKSKKNQRHVDLSQESKQTSSPCAFLYR